MKFISMLNIVLSRRLNVLSRHNYYAMKIFSGVFFTFFSKWHVKIMNNLQQPLKWVINSLHFMFKLLGEI